MQIVQKEAHTSEVLLFCVCVGVFGFVEVWGLLVWLFFLLVVRCFVGLGAFFLITDPAVDVLQQTLTPF